MADVDDLLLALMDEAPTDDEYLVYADAASSRGDPRGELVVIQHALRCHELTAEQRAELRAREAELLDVHDELGGLRRLFASERADNGLRWRNGFVHAARLDLSDSDNLDRDNDVDAADALAAILAHPSGVLLRELVLVCGSSGDRYDRELAVLERYCSYTLRRLVLNDRWSDDEPDDPRCYDISWFAIEGLSRLVRGAPYLERLELIAGDFIELEHLALPRLRSLALRTGGLRPERFAAIAERTWPQLERFELWFGRPHYGGTVTVEDLAPLLVGDRLPSLRWLGLMNAEFTDEACELLERSAILAQLDGLSRESSSGDLFRNRLALGCLSSAGARFLSSHQFAHLDELDVSLNMLDAPSVRALELAFGPQLRVGRQRADRLYRYATVGE